MTGSRKLYAHAPMRAPQQGQSNSSNAFKLSRVAILSLTMAFAGCRETSTACVEEQNPLATQAEGTLHITYKGRFGVSPSESFSTLVFVSRPQFIEVSGCALDNENTLWRFWSEWAFPDVTIFPTEIRATSDLPAAVDASVPGFWGNFEKCPENDCTVQMDNILHESGGIGRPQGSGIVDIFNIESGRFLTTAPVRTDNNETVHIRADISWPPAAFTFSESAPDGGLSDAAADGGP
jgi:hypothetical protein